MTHRSQNITYSLKTNIIQKHVRNGEFNHFYSLDLTNVLDRDVGASQKVACDGLLYRKS